MKKMPCLFQRNFTDKNNPELLPIVTLGCEWVLDGIGVGSRKFDGTSCMILNRELYARYDAKINPKTKIRKMPPVGSIPCQPEPDSETGHWPHWVKVVDQPQYSAHLDAWKFVLMVEFVNFPDGTYELIGPKVNGNPEKKLTHCLVQHGKWILDAPRTFNGLRDYLAQLPYEGIVFNHQDKFCKIRRKDFGLDWPVK